MERTRTRSRTWLLCLAGLLTVLVAATTQSAGAAAGTAVHQPDQGAKGADPWSSTQRQLLPGHDDLDRH